MMSRNDTVIDPAIFELLNRFGISARYVGFFHMAFAVQLCVEDPWRLTKVTKVLYHEVAGQYGTTYHCVERNIRTAIAVAWNNNRPLLEAIAKRSFNDKPTASEFIAILTAFLSPGYSQVNKRPIAKKRP